MWKILEKELRKRKNKVGKQKMVALIVYRNKIISIGHNQNKTSPLQAKYNTPEKIFIHAEVDAIAKAAKYLSPSDFKRAELYIGRLVNINGEIQFGSSKPCKGCQRCISAFGIQNVYYH